MHNRRFRRRGHIFSMQATAAALSIALGLIAGPYLAQTASASGAPEFRRRLNG
jgi:hypothetical protein